MANTHCLRRRECVRQRRTRPGRATTSFTFSPIAMGGPLIGGIPTSALEKCIGESRRKDFTLAAAVALSGAAIAVDGKGDPSCLRFLLGLANVRLGVWVPNPRRAGRSLAGEGKRLRAATWEGEHAPPPVRRGDRNQRPGEAACRTASRAQVLDQGDAGLELRERPYLYVTDGGHYENLGLVELLRRGCTEIFCFDERRQLALQSGRRHRARPKRARGGDHHRPVGAGGRMTSGSPKACVSGEILYPNRVRGVLIHARSVVRKSAPYDVQALRITDAHLPAPFNR